ncbi:MAG: hypothetical protein ACRDJT_10660 [Actinomycetota bacterium]
MSHRSKSHARLAWILCAVCLLLYAGALVLLILNRGHARPEPFSPLVGTLFDLLTSAILPVVGAVIASHRPRNPIGWLLLTAALASSAASLGGEWAFRALLVDPGSLPGGGPAVLMTQTLWVFNLSALPLVVLLFPDGALPSPRWRPVAAIAAAPAAVGFPLLIASTWGQSTSDLLLEENPGVGDFIIIGVILCALLTIGASILALILRYARGGATRRRQIQWLLVAALILLLDGITVALFETDALWRQVISSVAFYSIPVAMAIAILRYRLYEIDRIINRALVYGALTLLLAGGYWLSVLLLQSVLPAAERSPLVVAASTLGIVALFRPLRTRVQSFIDRRFYRTRYDAERTVADFGARLRQEIDLDELCADLVGVVRRTVQPSLVSLWLRTREGSE